MHDCHYTVTSCKYCDTFKRFYATHVTLHIYCVTKGYACNFCTVLYGFSVYVLKRVFYMTVSTIMDQWK